MELRLNFACGGNVQTLPLQGPSEMHLTQLHVDIAVSWNLGTQYWFPACYRTSLCTANKRTCYVTSNGIRISVFSSYAKHRDA